VTTTLAAAQTINVGEAVVIEASNQSGSIAVVFEDDGECGYLYAVAVSGEDLRILDAMHIYAVDEVPDRDQPCHVRILWIDDGDIAALTLNDHPHAVFDFPTRRGYCRSAYPEPPANSNWTRHGWDDGLEPLFVAHAVSGRRGR
jgi:hypothetical protein